jgi:UDP-N-acetylmuramyl pentapeptide phosphotransferase/UDP-N-acetylglucosamine-1-phosphate transferase
MISLSPRVRFVVEILLVLYLIYTTGFQLNNFHGLWGLGIIPGYISVPLTIFACVGIINAINLIDGVDGYSSGYSVISCLLFGLMFHALGNVQMVVLAAVVAASLLPFFLHNVFGKHSKMFIGDAGTLSLGIIFSVFVTTLLSTPSGDVIAHESTLGLVPFTLAVLCVPIFDTLRVMSSRMIRGKSPFNPDKTHLHHLFIGLGVSHIGTAVLITLLNLAVVGLWYLSAQLGASADVQLYVVIAASLLLNWGIYYGVQLLDHLYPEQMNRARIWKSHHRPSRRIFDFMRKIVDKM